MDIPDEQFYDMVARKFGGYHTHGLIYESRYPDGDPEQVFLQQLLGFAGQEKIAVDIGCGDGRFTLKIAQYFERIFGIDVSSEMLVKARQFQDEQRVPNVTFQKADADQFPFQEEYLDVIYSRRGPSPCGEIGRVIKQGGYYAEICIGEKDAQELKAIFGRGQGFGEWGHAVSKVKTKELEKLGFSIVFVRDYFYLEIYPDLGDLNLFLQGVPIFKDFDPKKDREFVLSYAQEMKVTDGIELRRHRVVIAAHK